ncbi:MAG: pyridoxal phosphate-dependent aminotransferase [Candidatus Njordarchaeia archaeon]
MKGKISEVSKFAVNNPSSIREIMTLVTDFKLHPEKYPRELIYLGGGWPQDAPPNTLREATSEVLEDNEIWINASRYGTTRGQPEFIEGVVKYEDFIFGKKINPEEVFVGSGSTELTAAIFLSILDPGSEVILTRPGYLNYERQIQIETALKSKVKRWDILKEGKFNPNLDELQSLITDNTRMIVVTTPGNPDGQVFSDDLINGIMDIAEDKGIWVMIDVAYRAFIFGETPRYFSKPRRENEIWMVTLSKEFRVPGWRMAYAVMDTELLKAVETIEQGRNLCPSRFAQEAFTRLFHDNDKLRRTKEFFDATRIKYRDVAEHTYSFLKNEISNIRPLKPMGGFYVFFDASSYSSDSRYVCSKLLNDYQVALVPGLDFGLDGWIRLSFAPLVESLDKLDEGLRRIKEFFMSR